MSIEMIEAAWTDPMLRRNLQRRATVTYPTIRRHSYGRLHQSADMESPTKDTLQCGYYWNSYTNCNATYSVSGGHCCQ